jgi:hypothetical protein
MDLLAIARKVWRYKLVTLPVVLLTLVGAFYVIAGKEPVYEASSSYLLISPPAPPTAEDIARDPALGRINADNPYTRFEDAGIMIEVLASRLSSMSARRALLKAGAEPGYKIAPAATFGYSSPIMKITAQGPSPDVAVASARVVGNALTGELARMQRAKGVDSQYRINAQQVDAPEGAQLRASGQLRMLVAVLVLGAVLLFVAVSAADALTTLRMERMGRASPHRLEASGQAWSGQDVRDEGASALAADDWSEFDEEPADSDRLINLFPDPDPHAAVRTPGLQAKQGSDRRKQRRSG